MRVREIAQFIHVSLSSDRGRASLNISQYLLRIVAKGTISIQRYKDWTLTYHIFFYLNKPFSVVHAKVTVMFLQTTNVAIMYHCYSCIQD